MKNLVLAIVFLLITGSNLFGGVNLKNGNFYISYTDHSFSSGYLIFKEITRTYNSKSTYEGLFGYGWGSEFETRLNAYPDGTVRITEHGGGGKTFFIPSLPSSELIDLMVDSLIDAMVENGDLENEIQKISKERNKLKNNIELRTNKWDKFVTEGLLDYISEFPDGIKWESYLRGNESLIFSNGKYIRQKDRTWTFNRNGQLTKVEDKDGFYSELKYSKGFLDKIINSDGSSIQFEVNQKGQVEKIISTGVSKGKKWEGISTYKYEGNNLIESSDAAKNIYKHSYDESHNMTSIIYEDNSKYLINYYPSTMYVKSLTDRNGEKTEYKYNVFYNEDGSIDKDHYGTYVTKSNYEGKPVTNYYEYIIKTKSSGDRYNSEIITEINGIRTHTKYDGLCESPVEISRGSQVTKFEYNNRCLLKSKKSNTGIDIKLEYHPELEKITKITSNGVDTYFDYNEKGDVVFAERPSDSLSVNIEYNSNGTIHKMKQGENLLKFEYNSMKKPVKIVLEGIGYMEIEYDKNGEITQVHSPDGRSMSIKVSGLFQELLSLIKPANMNLEI